MRLRGAFAVSLAVLPPLALAAVACSTTVDDSPLPSSPSGNDAGQRQPPGDAAVTGRLDGPADVPAEAGPPDSSVAEAASPDADGPDSPDGGTDAAPDASPEAGDACYDGGDGLNFSLHVENQHLTPDLVATVAATVTDTYGLGTITSVDLYLATDSGDGPLLAAFTEESPGSYTASITWDQLNAVQPINTRSDQTQNLIPVWVMFTDRCGSRLATPFSFVVSCTNPEDGTHLACNGACGQAVDTPTDCGACGIDCTASGQTSCVDSRCAN